MDHTFDIAVLTGRKYINDSYPDNYSQNVVDEDNAVLNALKAEGLKAVRTYWDNPDFDWGTTRYILFRTIWDYFDRFDEFAPWLEQVSAQTKMINPPELIYWNIDKFYLRDLDEKGVAIPPTVFIEKGTGTTLSDIASGLGWEEYILKPAVSGAARHTYRIQASDLPDYEGIFKELIRGERMLLQQFQKNILDQGEVAFMVFGGKFSHAVLKKAKPGDFRVQDDFGGTVHPYLPHPTEISFVEKAIASCPVPPVYARADVMWDNEGGLCLGELELIEPELWFRMNDKAATLFAKSIKEYIS